MKHEKNDRVEVYYERLLKLANSFQHKTLDSFLIIVFRSRLQPSLWVAIAGTKKETMHNIRK
jgi:hypothetical protein